MNKFIFCYIILNSVNIIWSNNENGSYKNSDDDLPYRLPKSFLPINYKLEMMPILDIFIPPGFQKFTSPGKVVIKLECMDKNSLNEIILHALNLTINESSIQVKDIQSEDFLNISQISYDLEFNFLKIRTIESFTRGLFYELFIEFITPIHEDRLNGMYLDYFNQTPDDGTVNRSYLATTLFAPYHARRAYPCFDEPDFRASFDISIKRHMSYNAKSNGNLLSSKIINGTDWMLDTFETTPLMSTYITAMIVSQFSYEELLSNNKSYRIYGNPTLIGKGGGKYGVNLTKDIVEFYEDFFQIEFPLTKLYSVALPQFFFNAMENWGLITYKEPALLYFANETTESERYKINYVVGHELAHQWFGNLVNCKWWTYVWLKEGPSTYFSHYAMNYTNPELEPWVEFQSKILEVALEFDSSNVTHPLENSPQTSEAVANIYTRIPYEKGAAILRMASSFLTETIFMEGIKLYLNEFKYIGAEQNDLFNSLQMAVDNMNPSIVPASVVEILDSWSTQPGFALIRAKTIDKTTVEISQEQFNDIISAKNASWWVPLTFDPKINSESPDNYPEVWLTRDSMKLNITINTNQTFIINPGGIGYYRVLYDDEMLMNNILVSLKNNLITSVYTRLKLLNDYYAFACKGIISKNLFESLVKIFIEIEENTRIKKIAISYLDSFFH